MDDLISRRDAIDAIVNTVSCVGMHDNSAVARYGATFRQHEIIDIIETLPPAQQWIPVSSGELPEKNTHVLVTDWGFVQEAYRSDDRRWYDLDGNKLKGVTAYMPLPKPWEGEEDE